MPFQHDPRLAARHAAGIDPRTAITTFQQATVAAHTTGTYNSRIKYIHAFLAAAGETTFTLALFAQMLMAWRTLGAKPSQTAEGYRSAILHHQRTHGLWCDPNGDCWADTNLCRAICRGYRYNGKTPDVDKTARGTLDTQMFQELIIHATSNSPDLVTAIRVAVLCALRPHQLLSISKGCYDPDTLKLWVPDKTATAANGKPFWADKDVLDPTAQAMLAAIEDITPDDTPYFPGVTSYKLRKCMKEAASHYGWTSRYPNLKFDGPHCLRHAGTLLHTTRLTSQGIPEHQQAALLRTSVPMIRHYRTTNAKRARK